MVGKIKPKSDGKFLEHVVKMLLAAIEPDSEIQHNVNLPVIGSPSGATRQCDVVITSGPAYRRTTTLVEVQDRNEQVDVNTFGGWLLKLEDVGAQHLICVSRKEFPVSIKEKAINNGGSIKLVCLSETHPPEMPLSLLRSMFTYQKYSITQINAPELIFKKAEAEELGIYHSINAFLANGSWDINSKVFSYDQSTVMSAADMCKDTNKQPFVHGSGSEVLTFTRDVGKQLYFKIDDTFTRIGMSLSFSWQNDVISYPMTIFSYTQQEDGSLALVAEGQYETPDGIVRIATPLIRKDGYYEIPGVVFDAPKGSELTLLIRD